MKLKKPNPLDYFGVRRVPVAPPHFEYEILNTVILKYWESNVIEWIERKLSGRYYFDDTTEIIDGNIITTKKIGFEKPSELSYFIISYPN